MPRKKNHVDPAVSSGTSPTVEFNPADLLSIDQVAERLRTDVAWVREKIRRRCQNPIPVYNLGRHLLFDWRAVSAWIAASGRGTRHAAHPPRRKKKQIDAGIAVAKRKAA